MKNFASFCTTFLLHTLVEMLQNVHFSKMKFFLSKNSEVVSFLDRFGAHSRARRPLHDRHFHTPFFWIPFFEHFPELECQKMEVGKFRIKGVPLWSLFFEPLLGHFLERMLQKTWFSKISDLRDSRFSVPGIFGTRNLANHWFLKFWFFVTYARENVLKVV